MDFLAILGAEVRLRRLQHSLSQEALAEKCGFDRTYISLIERGKRNPSLSNLIKLAAGLDMTASELIRGIEDCR